MCLTEVTKSIKVCQFSLTISDSIVLLKSRHLQCICMRIETMLLHNLGVAGHNLDVRHEIC